LYKNKLSSVFRYVALSTLCAIAIMSLALPFASQSPDGLEKVSLNLGFYEHAKTAYEFSPMQGYTFFGQESYIFVLLSGIVGAIITFVTSYAISKIIISQKAKTSK